MQFIYNTIMLNNYLIITTTCKNNDIIYKCFVLDKIILNAKISSENIVFV